MALLIRTQAGAVLEKGGYSAIATISLLVLLLLGGFGGALYALATSFEDPKRKVPAVIGVVASIAAVLYLTMSMR